MRSEFDTVAKRSKLDPRKNPYWQGVSGGRGGVSLGYRKPARGHGSWIAKIVIDGARIEERIGAADDEPCATGALSYVAAVSQAIEWGRRQYASIEAQIEAGAAAAVPTVRSAVEDYLKVRRQRSAHTGRNASSRLKAYVLSEAKFSATRLARLRSTTIEDWREKLPSKLKSATVNRLLADLRAALNAAAEKHRRELPGNIAAEIRIGTKALPVLNEARRQLLPDETVQAIVAAAYEVDEDFGDVVLLAAATGARYSQLTRIRIRDVQDNRLRILVPASQKGRGNKSRPPIAVPVDVGVIRRLRSTMEGRNGDELLLQRWAYRRVGRLQWEKDRRCGWGPAYEVGDYWPEVLKRAKAPEGTIMYALRHSSIVRGLTVGLPIRLVAALHDTSVEMIEKHYAAYIVDATEELARRATVSFAA